METIEAVRRIRNHMEVHRIGEYPHIYIGEALNKAIDALQKVEQLERQNAALIKSLKENVADLDRLCPLCKFCHQCDSEADNVDDRTTRFWQCKVGQFFEIKEDPNGL